MAKYLDLKGTTENIFRIGVVTANHILKAVSGGIALRDPADISFEKIQVSTVEASADNILINSDASGAGNDWTLTFGRNPAQTANLTFLTPPAKGTDGFVLRQKAGTAAGVLELELAADQTGGNGAIISDTTNLAFGTASPLALFTSPANCMIEQVRVVIDTPFDGTPTMSVGITGTTSKYMSSGQVNLKGAAEDIYETNPGKPLVSGENLIVTYSAGGATVGAARVFVRYSIPV